MAYTVKNQRGAAVMTVTAQQIFRNRKTGADKTGADSPGGSS
jgi:hypothetical protein